jgi:hypothetical protein
MKAFFALVIIFVGKRDLVSVHSATDYCIAWELFVRKALESRDSKYLNSV